MNNFDSSSTGLNLELAVSFDAERARSDFTACFKQLHNEQYLFMDYGNISEEFDLADLDKYDLTTGTKADIKAWYVWNISHFNSDQNDSAYKCHGKTFSRLTKQELIEVVIAECDTVSAIDFLTEMFTPKYEVIRITGNCQGEIDDIILTQEVIATHTFDDREEFLSRMSDQFTNLFYNQPLYARLTVNGEEHYLDCETKDAYTYDQEELLKIVDRLVDIETYPRKADVLAWVKENLPAYPDTY